MQKRRLLYFSLTLILLSSSILLNVTDFDKVYAQETVDYQKLSDAQNKLTDFMKSSSSISLDSAQPLTQNEDSDTISVFLSYVDTNSGKLVVGVNPSSYSSIEQNTQEINEIVGNDIPLEIGYGFFKRDVCDFQNTPCNPIIGGIQVTSPTNPDSGVGTIGLPVTTIDGVAGFIMSAHVAGIEITNERVGQPFSIDEIGTIHTNPLLEDAFSDSAFVAVDDDISLERKIYLDDDGINHLFVDSFSDSSDLTYGISIRMISPVWGDCVFDETIEETGQVFATDLSVTDIDYGTLVNQVAGNYDSCDGDSGAPVISNDGDGSVSFYGIHVGRACYGVDPIKFKDTTEECIDIGGAWIPIFSTWESTKDRLQLTDTNFIPTADSISPTIQDDGTYKIITLTADDTDHNPLIFSITSPPSGTLGTITQPDVVRTEATVTYLPDPSHTGTDSFQFIVNDGMDDSSIATVSITIESTIDSLLPTNTSVTTGNTIILPNITQTEYLSFDSETLTFDSPDNSESAGIVVSIPSNVDNPILYFDSDDTLYAASISDDNLLQLAYATATTYYAALDAGTTTQMDFTDGTINISNLYITVDDSNTNDPIELGYLYDTTTTTNSQIIDTTVDYDADEIQIQFDIKIDTDFTGSDFDVISTLDDSTEQTLIVDDVENYDVASAFRTLVISGQIPSNTVHLFVDVLNNNLVDEDGEEISDIMPFDGDVVPEDTDDDGGDDTNTRPFSDAGPNQQKISGDTVTLDGSGSSDAEDDALSYLWMQTDSSGYGVTLSDSMTQSPTFTAPDVSAYTELTFELTVTEFQTTDALSDDGSVSIFVAPLSQSRDPDYFIPHPSPNWYENFGEVVDTSQDRILTSLGSAKWISVSSILESTSDVESALQSLSSDAVTIQTIDVQIITNDDDTLQAVIDGTTYSIIDTIFLKDDTQSFADAISSSSITSSDSSFSLAEEEELVVVAIVDENNNKVYLVDSITTQALAFSNYWGYAYLYDYTISTPLTTTQGPGSLSSDYAEDDLVLFDSDSMAVSDTRYEYSDPSAPTSGLIHIYDDVSAGVVTDPNHFLENPERNTSDRFGGVMTDVGSEKIAVAGNLSYMYLYSKDGTTQINSFPNPESSSSDFNPDSIESFGSEMFVVGDNSKVYVFSESSQDPLLTIDAPTDSSGFGKSVATNYANNWILVGAPSTTINGASSAGSAYLFDATTGTLIHTIPNPEPAASDSFGYSVSFVKNKILVGAPDDDPNGISGAGSVYLFSPADGSMLEAINNDRSYEKFGFFVGEVDSGEYIVISSPEYDGTYTDEGRIFIYSNTNNIPVANADVDSGIVEAGDTVTLDGTASYDPDGDGITYLWVQTDSSGYAVTLSDSMSQSPIFTAPDVTVDTILSFALTVNDGIVDSAAASTVDVTITLHTNLPPTAIDDVTTVDEGQSIDIDVLSNDVDSDGTLDVTSVNIVFSPVHGVTSINATDGIVTYTHDGSESITDSITYTVNDDDGDSSNVATVSITITPINDAPVLDGIGNQITDELVLLSFNATATDADGDTLSFSLTNGTSGLVPIGAEITTDGLFTWTPTESQVGTHTFDVTVTDGMLSDSETIQVTVATVPTHPTITSTTSGDEQVTLEWTAPTDDGGSDITGYKIEYTTNNPNLGVEIDWDNELLTLDASLTATVTNLTNGNFYYFRVFAINDIGTGPAWAPVGAIPTDATVPGAPTLSSTTPNDQQVTLEWDAPTDDGGSDITGYVVEYTDIPSIDDIWNTSSGDGGDINSTTATVTGLDNGTPYTFRVYATNSQGDGVKSDTLDATPATVPTHPTITSTTSGDEQVTLEWTAPTDDGGSDITGYKIEYTTNNPNLGVEIDWDNELLTLDASLTATVTNLTNGNFYYFRVFAINDIGTGPAWAPVGAIPNDITAPVIILTGDNPQTIKIGTGYMELGATSDDGSTVIINATEFADAIGTYSIYYDATDDSGNAAIQVIRTVNVIIPPGIIAIGGTITEVDEKIIHTFTIDDTFTVISGSGDVEYLILGGGGGGGGGAGIGYGAGGGGAGDYQVGTAHHVSVQDYPVIVGITGATGTAAASGSNGGSSSFDGIVSIGGGGGGPGSSGGANGNSGGSGGGAGARNFIGSSSGGSATGINGFPGGNNNGNSQGGAGGGGAGGPGGSVTLNPGGAGGGAGLLNSITGTSIEYGHGGSGGQSAQNGGSAGPGIVIISYDKPDTTPQ